MINLTYRKKKKKNNNIEKQKATDLFMNANFNLTDDYKGITNIGDSCYINSVIQLLYSCDIFYNLITDCKAGGETQKILRTIFLELNSGFNPDTKELISKLGFQKKIAEDAQDALSRILDLLNDEFKNSIYANVFDILFRIKLDITLNCKPNNQEEHIHERQDNNITLTILVSDSIDKCFKIFSNNIIDSYECDKFNIKVDYVKETIRISKFPVYLIISLKRFNNHLQKNNIKCYLTSELDVNEYNSNRVVENYSLFGIIIHQEFIGKNNEKSGHYMLFIFLI